MKTNKLLTIIVALLATGINTVLAQTANMQDRALWGSIATPPSSGAINSGSDYTSANNKVLLTWRMLPGDTEDTAFNLWRKMGDSGNWACVNDAFKQGNKGIKATNYQHAPLGTVTGDIHYRLTYADPSKTGVAMTCDEYIGEYTMKMEQAKAKVPYVSIPLQPTTDCSDYPDIFTYEANDCSVGDLDGDGQMEIVVKRLLAGGTADDSGSDPRARHTIIWDAYKLDGTLLWRVKSGPNIIVGNSSSVMLGDLDGDGCAEFVLKTGEGTVFGDGKEIGDTDNDGITDYRQNWGGHYTGDKAGKYGGPEYFSVVDGKTGRELARANFIARGPEGQTPAQWVSNCDANSQSWGDGYWKRANSLRLGLACFTGKGMQIFLGRGVYARTVVEGWDFKPGTPDGKWQLEGSLTRLWKFDSSVAGGSNKNKDGKPNSAYAGQGNHAFNVADLDGDGLDEVMYGSCAFDHDGTGLWSTGLGHGDANHVGVFQKDYEGLQVYHCLESGTTEVALHDAKTGTTIWDVVADAATDQGRCMVADVDPTSPGCEFWMSGNKLFDQDGTALYNSEGNRKEESSCNAGIWFDGYLNRQMINENTINSFSHGRTFTIYRYDISFNNSTKSNPGWYGDMLGDWREEVIVPSADKLTDIKLFSTWYPTEHRIPWLMTDHTYYMQAIHENVGYNQPTNVGYYLGSDYTSDAEIWAAAAKAQSESTPSAVTVAIGPTGFATYSHALYALDFSGTAIGLDAYAVMASGGVLSFEKITGAVPANTGVLLHAPAGDYQIPVAVAGVTPEYNDLVSTNTTLDTETYNYYALAELTQGVGFKLGSGAVLSSPKANKAYLQVAKGGEEARQFLLNFSSETTGVDRIENSEFRIENSVFDLQGRKVNAQPNSQFSIFNSQLKRGLSVVRGRKVIVK